MKKSLFFAAAASALMLTACSSENDVVQSAPQTQETTAQAVGFDVYTPAATDVTRAGMTGMMTTNRMQLPGESGGGFGVYSFLTEDAVAAAGDGDNATAYAGGAPNFMVNEKILWNNTNLGWYYNPLKYWPNETDHDSQSTNATMEGTTPVHLDRLTFFAYAPYVSGDAGTTGITNITDKAGQLNGTAVTNPTIAWTASATPTTDFNPNQGVDLLWGVAPSGGLSYTAVNGWTVTRKEGTPLLNMIKPDVNTSMKFLFQHALARFGINVVAAVDQVSPGGKLDPNTKITINSLKITGPFGTTGNLDLNNGEKASVANWTLIGSEDITSGTTTIPATNGTIVVAANATNNAIAENLRWKKDDTNPHTTPLEQTVVGVTTAKQDLLAPSTKWFNKLASAPAYNPGKKYYTDETGSTPALAKYTTTKKGECYTYDETNKKYVAVESGVTMDAPVYPNFNANGVTNYYTVTVGDTYLEGENPDGDNSYAPVRYSFESYGDAACSEANKYGNGVVEFAATDNGRTQVTVTVNNPIDQNAANYVGQSFWVNATVLDPNATYELYGTSDAATGLGIYVKNVKELKYGYNDAHLPATTILYKVNGTGTDTWYEYVGTKTATGIDWENGTNTYVTLNGSKINVNAFDYAYDPAGTYYEAERNYLYVVPTNAALDANFGGVTSTDEKALRTITLQIEYYISTEDDKLATERAETKNVITKEVVLPSLANGKSYMLNLILGLTSVKVEAEVDDWKVINVQADLPQNTAE